ncbi:MAG: YccF domain-containing protein [Acidobacteriota bacterium]
MLAFLGNVIWLIFGGFLTGLGYILGGLALCLTIVGIPFGWGNIKLGFATFAPFGKEVVARDEAAGVLRVVFNVIWLLLFGWEIALLNLLHAILLTITIIGIPFAKQHWKLIPMSLMPFGRELRRDPAR